MSDHEVNRLLSTDLAGAGLDILADLRSGTRALLATATTGDTIDAAVLITNELATNALIHAAPAGEARLQLHPGRLYIAIDDTSPALPTLIPTDGPPRGGGLGLHLVARLAAQWGHTLTPTGKTVWALLDL